VLSPESPTAGDGAYDLTVVFDDGHDSVVTWRLTSDPSGGDHPDSGAARRALLAHPAALRPVPKDQLCTQIYGGPATARVTGTWQGQPVASRFSLVNGCEIARWRALTGLLPPPTG
jgi:hypothetical protein